MKVTKAMVTEYVKHQLATNPQWALRALSKIYEFQTAAEQATQQTSEDNGVGFSGVDSQILSSFAQQYNTRGSLSFKQMNIVFKKMPRYSRQIISLIPETNLQKVEADALAYANSRKTTV